MLFPFVTFWLVINGAYATEVAELRKTLEVRHCTGGAWKGRTFVLVQNKHRGRPALALGRGHIVDLLEAGTGLAAYQQLFDDPRSCLKAVRDDPPTIAGKRVNTELLTYTNAIWCRGGGSTADLRHLREGREPGRCVPDHGSRSSRL